MRATRHSAGVDLPVMTTPSLLIVPPGGRSILRLTPKANLILSIASPKKSLALICNRSSSCAANYTILPKICCPYYGVENFHPLVEWDKSQAHSITLVNTGTEPLKITKGFLVCQVIFIAAPREKFITLHKKRKEAPSQISKLVEKLKGKGLGILQDYCDEEDCGSVVTLPPNTFMIVCPRCECPPPKLSQIFSDWVRGEPGSVFPGIIDQDYTGIVFCVFKDSTITTNTESVKTLINPNCGHIQHVDGYLVANDLESELIWKDETLINSSRPRQQITDVIRLLDEDMPINHVIKKIPNQDTEITERGDRCFGDATQMAAGRVTS